MRRIKPSRGNDGSSSRRRGCYPHKLLAPIALRIQQRGEVAVVDPRGGSGGDRGLGVIGDAEARRLDHAEIVGAVAGHQRVDVVEVEDFAKLDQRCQLGGAAEDRLGDFAGELAVVES